MHVLRTAVYAKFSQWVAVNVHNAYAVMKRFLTIYLHLLL